MEQSTKEESIFEVSNFELKKYQKHVTNARTALFVIAGLMVLSGIISSFMQPSELLLDIWIEVLVVGGAFLVLAMVAEKKPYNALIAGLVVYILYIILYFVIDPSTIFRGIIVKIIVITYLIKGIINAGEIKDIKKMTGS